MVDVTEDESTPGWDAIDAALERLYPGVTPRHLGTIIKWTLGGPDPLDGISIYRRADHWHYVSYGMSELYTKESPEAEISGWGFEFTFRLACAADETEPPIWPANFLQNLGRYVFTSGNPFGVGHHLDLNGPIATDQPDTAIRAAVFTTDPELGSIETPHGALRFLQVVGITVDEYAAVEQWNTNQFLDVVAVQHPLLITDLYRPSYLDDPAIAATIAAGTARDGSSTSSLYVHEASWRLEPGGTVLIFGAHPAERIGRVLAARLTHGLGLMVSATGSGVGLVPGDELTVDDIGSGELEVTVPPALVGELVAALRPVAGVYPMPSAPTLTVEIVRSQIRDRDGNVVEEIG